MPKIAPFVRPSSAVHMFWDRYGFSIWENIVCSLPNILTISELSDQLMTVPSSHMTIEPGQVIDHMVDMGHVTSGILTNRIA